MTAVWIREKEWQTATLSAVAHSKGQKKLFFRLLDLDILNSSVDPHEEYVGTHCTRKENAKAIR
jgi:hypothetical protein